MDLVTNPEISPEISVVARSGHPSFLDLPWHTPLEQWTDRRLVKMAHGISRHVVRFVRYESRVYALKATDSTSANHEYRLLGQLRDAGLPVVEPVGVVTVGSNVDATLITRFLDYSFPHWYVIGREWQGARELFDSGVVLLVRLHLAGVYWGDCSLSNVLFRRDAGAVMAYLVDAETAELRPSISAQLRMRDVEIARENMVGGILDLQASGRVSDDVDPIAVADELTERYSALWDELTHTDEIADDERWRIDQRVRRLNDLGFDVEEMAIESTAEGRRLRITPTIIEEGHHCRELRGRTGLEVQENQARRLLADIGAYRAYLEDVGGIPVPSAVAGARWLSEVYAPVVARIPADLRGRLEAPEFFHQLLEHRYFMSERVGRGVTTDEALADFLERVLPSYPEERLLIDTVFDVDGS